MSCICTTEVRSPQARDQSCENTEISYCFGNYLRRFVHLDPLLDPEEPNPCNTGSETLLSKTFFVGLPVPVVEAGE